LDWLVRWVRDFGGPLDLILYAGDDIARFRPDAKTNYFEQLAALTRYGLCAVAGNDDDPTQRALITGRSVHEVHRRPVLLGDYCILGLEGAPDRPGEDVGIGYLLHTEREIAAHLAAGARTAGGRRIVLLSHAPPYDCLDTALRFGVRRIGSQALARWLRKASKQSRGVAAVVCGHVHRCGGQERAFHGTVVANVASHDNPGEPLRIAWIHDRPGWAGQPAFVTWGLACEHDELQRVNGIGPEYAARLGKAGVKTIADLASCPPETVGSAVGWRAERAAVFPARARALCEQRPIPCGPLRVPAGPRLYFDIETNVPPTFVWLIGCYVEATGEVRQFLASRPEHEGEMLREFADFAAGVGDVPWVYFSGSDFDRRILVPRLQHHGLPVPLGLTRSMDVQPPLRAAVAPPVSSFGLKEVASVFGYRYQHPNLDGLAVAGEYLECVSRGRPIPERLLAYNRDDLLSLHHVVECVAQLCDVGSQQDPRVGGIPGGVTTGF
jgi:Icc-related predicted phosphoesterase